MNRAPVLLEVRNLAVSFLTRAGQVRAVDGLSFILERQQALAVVGESGSGKTVSALSILRLFGPTTRVRLSGEILFEGQNLLALSEAELRRIRGRQIGMVFQDPLTSLNPTLSVGEQIGESLRQHLHLSPAKARQRAAELLELVGIAEPHRRLDDLPHQFSGGMRQRIMIAIAIACQPKLLIADEPTTALDVTVQAQVLLLLNRLRRELGMALLLITHDFGVVAATCDVVQVMYAGRLLERGNVREVLQEPAHPYTAGLLRLVPSLDQSEWCGWQPIPGQPPSMLSLARGCRFAPRCEFAADRCRLDDPPWVMGASGRGCACWFPLDVAKTATASTRPG